MGMTLHREQRSHPKNLQIAERGQNGCGQPMEHRAPSSLLSVEEKKIIKRYVPLSSVINKVQSLSLLVLFPPRSVQYARGLRVGQSDSSLTLGASARPVRLA